MPREVWIKKGVGFDRTLASGKTTHVRGHKRKIKDNPKYEPVDEEWAKLFIQKDLYNTHPDYVNTSKVVFHRANKLWAKNRIRYDVFLLDCADATEFLEVPKKGEPDQIIKVKGKYYVADRNGRFKPYSLTEEEQKMLKKIDKKDKRRATEDSKIQQKSDSKEKETKKVLRTPQEKENLKRYNDVKEKIFKDVSDESPFENSTMDKDRIQILTTHEIWNDSGIGRACEENKEITGLETNKFIIDKDGDKLILIDNKGAYDMAIVKNALKHLDKDTTKIYFREDFPLVLKDKNLVLAIAPRALEDDESDTCSKEDRFKEQTKGLVISEKEYNKLIKQNTKEDLAKKLGKYYGDNKYPFKNKTKDQMIHDLLANQEFEKMYGEKEEKVQKKTKTKITRKKQNSSGILPKLEEDEKYYIVSINQDGYVRYHSHTTKPDKAIKDFEDQKKFSKKWNAKEKDQIVKAKDIHEVREIVRNRGKEDYIITGNTYENRKKIHNIAYVKFDYNKKAYRGKLSQKEIEELKKIEGLKIEKSTEFTDKQKQESKKARAEAKAEKWKKQAERLEKSATEKKKQADNIRGVIPLGQPILVGHHSETRHRNTLERMNRLDHQSYEESKKAEKLRSKANSIEASAEYKKGDIKRAEEKRRKEITPKLIEAQNNNKKIFTPLHREWFTIEKVNKKTVRVKDKSGYEFLIDKTFITQIEN